MMSLRNAAAPLVLSLVVLVACQREKAPAETPPVTPTADVVASPVPLEFGFVPMTTTVQKEVVLENQSDTVVHLRRVNVINDIAFGVGDVPAEIPARSSVSLPVLFHPKDFGAQGTTLMVFTDSERTPGLSVLIRGTGRATSIKQPPSVDFGAVLTGEEKTMSLVLENAGPFPEEVTITDPSSLSPSFTSGSAQLASIRIEPKETVEVPITFRPLMDRPVGVYLPVSLCAGCTPAKVSLYADGVDSYFSVSPLNGLNIFPDEHNWISLKNKGEAPITVTSLELVSGSDWLSLNSAGPLTIPPHREISVTVTGQFDGFAHEGLLKITTTDARRPEALISITTPDLHAKPCFLIAPDELNFGTAALTCPAHSKTITIYNSCGWGAEFESATLTNSTGEFQITTPSLPVTVTASKPAKVVVQYLPTQGGDHTAQLDLKLEGSTAAFPISISGTARSVPPRVDTWMQPPLPQYDMLLVIDDSPAMAKYQSSLETNLAAYKQFWDSTGFDVNFAVTTMDVSNTGERGQFMPLNGSRPRVVGLNAPNGNLDFHDNVNVGTAGSAMQHGLEAATLALDPTLLSGANSGFLRSSAFLDVVLISGSPESSPGVVDDYVSQLAILRGNASMLSINTVSVPTPTGDRYAEAAKKTGGMSTSIDRADWVQVLSALFFYNSPQMSHFLLATEPRDPAQIVVKVNGLIWPAVDTNGATIWSYTATRAIDFASGTRPPPGSTIEISYEEACP